MLDPEWSERSPQYTNWNAKYTYSNANGSLFNNVMHKAVDHFQ